MTDPKYRDPDKPAALLPCPFCGSAEAEFMYSRDAVYCHGCTAEGPNADGRKLAAEAWNRRAMPDVSKPASQPSPRLIEYMRTDARHFARESGIQLERVLLWQAADRIDALEAALRELVRLKDMKDRMDEYASSRYPYSVKESAEVEALLPEYSRCKPLAWDTARRLLPSIPEDKNG